METPRKVKNATLLEWGKAVLQAAMVVCVACSMIADTYIKHTNDIATALERSAASIRSLEQWSEWMQTSTHREMDYFADQITQLEKRLDKLELQQGE